MLATQATEARRPRRRARLIAGLWLVALALNVAFCLLKPGGSPDSARYERIGANLAAGHGYSSSPHAPYKPEVLRPPGYPLLLAIAYRLITDGPLMARLIQAFLLSLLVPLGYYIARDAMGGKVGLVTAFLIACYPYYWIYSASLLSDALATFLMAVVAAALVWSVHSRRHVPPLLVGVCIGLLALVKPIAVFLPLWAALCYYLRPSGAPAWPRRTLLCIVGCAMVVLPWTLHNYRATGVLLPIASGKGMQLYAAAISTARGYSVRDYFADVLAQDPRLLRAQLDDDPYVTMSLDDELWWEGLALYAAHPGRLIVHLLVTPVRVWLSVYSWGPQGFHISWPHLVLSAGLLLMGIAGIIMSRRNLRRVVVPLGAIVYFSAVHAPFWPEARQTLPVRLFLLMFVAVVLVRIAEQLAAMGRADEANLPS